MSNEKEAEVFGRYRILDSGVTGAKRHIVIEDTTAGPTMLAGPFNSIDEARRAARELAAIDEAADDQARRRQDHRHNDGDDHDGDKPSPRKAAGWHH